MSIRTEPRTQYDIRRALNNRSTMRVVRTDPSLSHQIRLVLNGERSNLGGSKMAIAVSCNCWHLSTQRGDQTKRIALVSDIEQAWQYYDNPKNHNPQRKPFRKEDDHEDHPVREGEETFG